MAGWKGRRQLASRRIKLYLHIVVLPEGRILMQLKARGGGGAAAAAELVVDAVQMHRGCAGGWSPRWTSGAWAGEAAAEADRRYGRRGRGQRDGFSV